MELLEGIATRRSTRAFKPTPVSKDVIARILEAAGRSPSNSNTQPWEVAVVTGKKRDDLSRLLYEMEESGVPRSPEIPQLGHSTSGKGWPPELDERAKDHGARRFAALGIERGDVARRREFSLGNQRFYGAPCVLYISIDKPMIHWSLFDAGLFAQSICLAAHSFGLGTCLQASVASYPDAVRQLLGIPDNRLIVIGIALGLPDQEAAVNSYHSTRIGPKEFASWHE
jgi:nitroreductase